MTDTNDSYINELSINQDYLKLVPIISDDEYSSLREDIRNNGLHIPIIINRKNEILDGHTRYRVCKELSIEPRTMLCSEEYEDPLLAKRFVLNINRNRRHLDLWQKGNLYYQIYQVDTAIYARERQLQPLLSKEDNDDSYAWEQKGGKKTFWDTEEEESLKESGRTGEIIASKSGMSASSYNRVKKLIEFGSEEAKLKLDRKESTVGKEYAKLGFAETREKLLAETSSLKLAGNIQLINADCVEYCKQIPDNSIDLILTDPLYARSQLYLYGEAAKIAARVLKPGGSLVCYTGNYFLPSVLDQLRIAEELEYVDQWIMIHNGHTIRTPRSNLNEKCKAIEWFMKKGSTLRLSGITHDNLISRSEAPDKALHWCSQSPRECEYVIDHITYDANQIILDPFLGSGTTAIAAINKNRKFIGIEIDKNTFDIATANIKKYQSEVSSKDNRDKEDSNKDY